jgi:hypothetical protein
MLVWPRHDGPAIEHMKSCTGLTVAHFYALIKLIVSEPMDIIMTRASQTLGVSLLDDKAPHHRRHSIEQCTPSYSAFDSGMRES